MLKKFFVTMLGSLAAIWISIWLLIIGGLFTIGMMVAKNSDTKGVSDKSILRIDLSGSIPERLETGSISQMIMSASDDADTSLEQILDAIRIARDDKKIVGIFLDCDGASLGVASRQEVIEAIAKFKETGKWVYAYADNFEQGDYYLASVADQIYLNPVGMVNIHGLQGQVMFYTNVLDKIGVKMQIVKVGEFKSAVEPFIRMSMSEPARRQMQIYLNGIWGNMTETIAANRSVTTDSINMWANALAMVKAPQWYVDNRVVSELRYRSGVEDLMRKTVGVDLDDKLPYISPAEYLAANTDKLGNPDRKHIAVLYAVGDIVDEGEGGIVGATMAPQIRELMYDDDVQGLILRVNSGGGSAFASEQIWEALEQFKSTGKPFYVSMGDMAASGGYYISCGADAIYADATTLTGSIGIFGMIPCAEKLVKDKIGLGIETVATNPGCTFPSLYEAMTPRQLDAMQQYVERGYQTFTSRVAQGRDIPVDSVKAIGGGRVWDGESALRIGLVDKLGSLEMAKADMAKELKMKKPNFVSYPEIEPDIWMAMIKQAMADAEVAAVQDIVPEQVAAYAEAMHLVRTLNPIQARALHFTIK